MFCYGNLKKTMMMKMIGALVLAMCLTACHNSKNDIVGTYGVNEHGSVQPFLKVTADGSSFSVSEFRNGQWNADNQPFVPFGREDLEKLTKHKVDVDVTGVQSGGLIIARVPAGWTDGGFTTKTGYFAFVLFGPVQLEKM